MKNINTLSLMVVTTILGPQWAQADLLNGNFEASPFDTSWTQNSGPSVFAASGIAPGSTQAALFSGIDTTTDGLYQDTASRLSAFTLSFWVRTDSVLDLDRSFNLVLGSTAGNNALNLRLGGGANTPGSGATLQAFAGGNWNDLSTADFFSVNSTYYFQLDVTGLGTGDINDFSYTVMWSDADPGSATTANSSGPVNFSQNTTHASSLGATLNRLNFNTDGDWNDYTLDDVSVAAVPEPSTFALAALGIAGLVIFRRRF